MAEKENKVHPKVAELEKNNKELKDTLDARSKLLDYYVNRCLILEQQNVLDKAQATEKQNDK
jgi:hypothetical protein